MRNHKIEYQIYKLKKLIPALCFLFFLAIILLIDTGIIRAF